MSTAVARVVADPPRLTVPNHLLDTQLFPSHATLNDVLAPSKQSVHFRGFQRGKLHRQKVQLTNKANGARRFHVLSPSSEYFNIRFHKTGKLMPGMSLTVTVEFSASEYNVYEDFIKIHCEGGHNLVIPLHAYPVLDLASFPKSLSFTNTPVCKSVFKKIKLSCPVAVDFLFRLQCTGHPSLSVQPTSGVIPGEGTVEVKVVFCPTEYITASAMVELAVQQFDNPVYKCRVTGVCQPGAEKDMVLASESTVVPSLSNVRKNIRMVDPVLLDPSTLTPMKKTRKAKAKKRADSPKGTVVDGVRFPENLNNPTAVAFVLNQKPGQLKASELKAGRAAAGLAKQIGSERQLKVAVFESIVKQRALEERNNKLRWITQLGDDPLSEEKRTEILAERERAQKEFALKRAEFDTAEEFARTETTVTAGRVYRLANEHTDLVPSFDPYLSSEWTKRKIALTRFIRAVRKIIVANRVADRFKTLQCRVKEKEDVGADPKCEIAEGWPEVIPPYLPYYHREEYDRDMTPQHLGPLTPPTVSLKLQVQYPIFDLYVPKSCDLLDYNEHECGLTAGQVDPVIPVLRTGAEDELTTVLHESDTLVSEVLTPPENINTPTVYPPLMIFNPAPGLVAHQVSEQCLESSEEFYLDPILKRPVRHRGPLQPLHKTEVIQGTQRWIKFPTQLLVSLNHTNSVGSVWVPRRDDLLEEDAIPDLLSGLSPDLEVATDEEEEEVLSAPTVEGVAAEFMTEFPDTPPGLPYSYASHSSSGPVQRRHREEQLSQYALERQNKLGTAIHERLTSLQDKIRDKNLHLC